MIKEFVEAWDANKNKLEDYFKNTKQCEYAGCYSNIVEKLFEIVINPYLTENASTYPLNNRI